MEALYGPVPTKENSSMATTKKKAATEAKTEAKTEEKTGSGGAKNLFNKTHGKGSSSGNLASFLAGAEEEASVRDLRFYGWVPGESFWCRFLGSKIIKTPKGMKKTADVHMLQCFDIETTKVTDEKRMSRKINLLHFKLCLLDDFGIHSDDAIFRITYQGKKALPDDHEWAGNEAHAFNVRVYAQDAEGNWGELYSAVDDKNEHCLSWDEPER